MVIVLHSVNPALYIPCSRTGPAPQLPSYYQLLIITAEWTIFRSWLPTVVRRLLPGWDEALEQSGERSSWRWRVCDSGYWWRSPPLWGKCCCGVCVLLQRSLGNRIWARYPETGQEMKSLLYDWSFRWGSKRGRRGTWWLTWLLTTSFVFPAQMLFSDHASSCSTSGPHWSWSLDCCHPQTWQHRGLGDESVPSMMGRMWCFWPSLC